MLASLSCRGGVHGLRALSGRARYGAIVAADLGLRIRRADCYEAGRLTRSATPTERRAGSADDTHDG